LKQNLKCQACSGGYDISYILSLGNGCVFETKNQVEVETALNLDIPRSTYRITKRDTIMLELSSSVADAIYTWLHDRLKFFFSDEAFGFSFNQYINM